ncbi:hypothetical protein CEXT_269151 [Caerostris extrusa]|uniref:Uncharacterized protein n=1 Tax=Caerostris extrusa TaxID=172846 RepID=A0AAV4R7Y1_CAEEX|nr:hypothetical protein CEXT_269151 [Caerostris extrusa]
MSSPPHLYSSSSLSGEKVIIDEINRLSHVPRDNHHRFWLRVGLGEIFFSSPSLSASEIYPRPIWNFWNIVLCCSFEKNSYMP